ncbi:TRAP transporter TatT component family protein [candidate division KSB1 bacterium]|nr:TRAP transporter TatT component family protein [candidate division KSB1 bacterium]
MAKRLACIIFLSLVISGCSVQRIAVRSMSGVLENSMLSLYQESDLKLAEQAIASDLKLLEGLLKSDPQNAEFLLMLSQGFTAYAMGFVEDDDPARARVLYFRARDYGIQLLKQKAFRNYPFQSLEELKQALQQFSNEDVAALFWTANSWAGWINLSFTNPQALADLPKVQLMMDRVIELDESFFFGGAHMFFGTIYAARPPLLGGDISKAEFHFNKCFQYADKKFLLPYVYYAKFYATRVFDEALFDSTISLILETPSSILPDQQLPNAIAQRKARDLKAQKDDLF